jgi:hypothetical protein
MPSTYTLIASATATGSSNTITFSAIPSTYTDLSLRYSMRNSGTSTTLDFYTNAGSTFTTGNTILSGNGSAAASSRTSNQYAINTNGAEISTMTASTFGNGEVYIPNYAISTARPYSTFNVTENNATATVMQAVASVNTTAEIITSFSITTGQNIVSGSTFYLYGIKKS